MTQNFEKDSWSYWARLDYWNLEEAALVLAHSVPDQLEDIFVTSNGESLTVRCVDMYGARNYLALVRNRFPDGRVFVKDFFPWCLDKHFALPRELVEEVAQIKSLNIKVSDFGISPRPKAVEDSVVDGRTMRHIKTRFEILCAALQVIDTKVPNEVGDFSKKSGGVNVEQLSMTIDDQRHKWSDLSDSKYGTSIKTIKQTLYDALKIK